MKKITVFLLFVSNIECIEGSKEPFERIVSIGCACSTRFQINYYLSEKYNFGAKSTYHATDLVKKNRIGGGSYPFDWSVIHDYKQLPYLLDNNFQGFFVKEDMENVPYESKGKKYSKVYDNKNKITWLHLFERENGIVTEAIFDKTFSQNKEKIDYLLNKFKELKSKRTLYVIHSSLNEDLIKKINNSLLKFRENDKNYSMLCTSEKNENKNLDNIFIRKSTNNLNVDENYQKILSEFEVKIEDIDKNLVGKVEVEDHKW